MWTAYAPPSGSIGNALGRLRQHVTDVPAQLALFSESALLEHAPDKWSRKEILGHLTDSAINNLKRFTDAQFVNEFYQIQSYNQDKLVLVNQYQHVPMAHLLSLWSSLNTQIIYVVEAIPASVLNTPVRFTNEDATGQTLGWLFDDYVAHLEHHLKTLL